MKRADKFRFSFPHLFFCELKYVPGFRESILSAGGHFFGKFLLVAVLIFGLFFIRMEGWFRLPCGAGGISESPISGFVINQRIFPVNRKMEKYRGKNRKNVKKYRRTQIICKKGRILKWSYLWVKYSL
ncbi:hypothetical protein MSSAC_3972 [Methanosarcina siciliae C2J]|uniref:Uncharacterized protein n=1 Tax=Methanosarcina siciliae C2J TaxID=1434118 RepID=A0A0E3PT14_9EURY|nr:hypothetical protein MSSAC_3972 [Methanosarcina siciliae C2J]